MTKILGKDQTHKILDYIAALENVNGQLLIALKRCVDVLAQFKDNVPNPNGWQEMLDLFEDMISVGDRVVEDMTLH